LKMRISYIAIALAALFACSAVAPAAPKKKTATKHKTTKAKRAKARPKAKIGAENGLVGIKLYDTGIIVLRKYGNPIDIQALSIGTTSAGGSAGRGGAGPAGPAGLMGAAGVSVAPGTEYHGDPTSVGFDDMMFKYPTMTPSSSSGPATAGMGGPTSPTSGGGSGAPGSMSGGAPGGSLGGSTTSTRTVFTRWVYRRPTGQYSFIFDKFNHVVQIEAVGLSDGKVRTARGVTLGASFKTIVEKYGAPDAYEIAGSSLVVRYLVRHKVAFRLNRLGQDKPHVVTGIVVAAGKS
jgi:hypothetical protein